MEEGTSTQMCGLSLLCGLYEFLQLRKLVKESKIKITFSSRMAIRITPLGLFATFRLSHCFKGCFFLINSSFLKVLLSVGMAKGEQEFPAHLLFVYRGASGFSKGVAYSRCVPVERGYFSTYRRKPRPYSSSRTRAQISSRLAAAGSPMR